MFSRNVEIRTTDAHSIVSRETGQRLNPAAPVYIGDHVWVGVGCLISKGAIVPTDTIIGAMSLVSKRFDEEGTVIAGSPARVLRRGVTWHRERRKKYSADELYGWQTKAEERID